jgi:hypothetical protein
MINIQIIPLLKIINQLFDLEKKLMAKTDMQSSMRNFERIKENFTEMGITIHSPLGEQFSETRTDCEASIAGALSNHMIITEVIKPIVYQAETNQRKIIIQRGVVIVQSK